MRESLETKDDQLRQQMDQMTVHSFFCDTFRKKTHHLGKSYNVWRATFSRCAATFLPLPPSLATLFPGCNRCAATWSRSTRLWSPLHLWTLGSSTCVSTASTPPSPLSSPRSPPHRSVHQTPTSPSQPSKALSGRRWSLSRSPSTGQLHASIGCDRCCSRCSNRRPRANRCGSSCRRESRRSRRSSRCCRRSGSATR